MPGSAASNVATADPGSSSLDAEGDAMELRRKRFITLLEEISAGMFAVVIVITFAQVVLRYAFKAPMFWAEELARYLFIWMSFTGATVAVALQAHTRIGFFVGLLPKSLQKAASVLVNLLCISFLGIVGMKGISIVRVALSNRSPALGVPLGLVYLALPVNAAIMIAYLLVQIVHTIHPAPGVLEYVRSVDQQQELNKQ